MKDLERHRLNELPHDATEASHIRYQLARDIAERCPTPLGLEVVLTGSASHGFSDEFSDIEMVFYSDQIPSTENRQSWLYEIDADQSSFDAEPIEDGSIWATFRYQGIWVEAGWQTFNAHERLLHDILAASIIDHPRLTLAEITACAVPLRTQGQLAHWQEQLTHYPDQLQRRLITGATELWMFPHLIEMRWVMARRGQWLLLRDRLIRAVYDVLRILFAVNKQWEPEWKWLDAVVASLSIKPERLVERINAIASMSLSEQSVAACLQLVLDTLLLIPPPYIVSRSVAMLQESLRKHGYSE